MARRAIALLFFVSLFAASTASAQLYDVVDLGSLLPASMNNSGQIVGTGTTLPHPLLWQDGVVTDLIQPGWDEGSALGINSSGTIVGQRVIWSNYQATRPFLYSGGTVTYLENSAAIGAARAISDTGIVAGFLQYPPPPMPFPQPYFSPVPFVWSAGVLTLLPRLGSGTNEILTINSAGVGAGRADLSTTSEAVYWQNGTVNVLPRLGSAAAVNAINDAGLMVGRSNTYAAPQHPQAVAWSNGALSALGTLGGADSEATAVNENGDIVGWSKTAAGVSCAFVYTGGAMTNLDAVAGAPNGWRLATAVAINDNGAIAGRGYLLSDPGTLRGFLLEPLPATPAKQVEQLITVVDAMAIDAGVSRSLTGKLQAALAAIGGERTGAACNQVQAFENEVQAQSGKKISAPDAEKLLAAAARVRTALGC